MCFFGVIVYVVIVLLLWGGEMLWDVCVVDLLMCDGGVMLYGGVCVRWFVVMCV